MQIIEPLNDCVADLYWLAFRITGHSGLSVDVTLEALDFQEGANSSSSTCMLPSLRRGLIAKALGAIRDELVASRRRTSSTRAKKAELPTWAYATRARRLWIVEKGRDELNYNAPVPDSSGRPTSRALRCTLLRLFRFGLPSKTLISYRLHCGRAFGELHAFYQVLGETNQ